MTDDADVILATPADLRTAVAGAVERSGFSAQELLAMHACGRYETVRARLAWVAVGPWLEDYVRGTL